MTKTKQVKRVELGSLTSMFKTEDEKLKTIEPTRRHSIVLDVQIQKQVEPSLLISTFKIEAKILKIVKPTQPLDHSQCSR